MNIVNKLTLRNLKLNKKRAMITIIGVVLSVAMITAASTFIQSMVDSLKSYEIKQSGNWHVSFQDVKIKDVPIIEKDDQVKTTQISKDLGAGFSESLGQTDDTYFTIRSMDDNAIKNNPIKLTSGAFPKGQDEILLNAKYGPEGNKAYNLNDTITFSMGKIDDETGDFTETGKQSFKIVGFAETEGLYGGSWTKGVFITYLDKNKLNENDLVNVSTVQKSISKKMFAHTENLAEKLGLDYKAAKADGTIQYNTFLLALYGVGDDQAALYTLYIFLAIIIFIIMIGAVSLIYNAFSISVSERSRYLGMMSSIGATKIQKRNSVFFEGLVIAGIGIPVGLLIGTLGMGATFKVINPLIESISNQSGFKILLSLSPVAIGLSVLLSLVTIFISIMVPARRASKASAISSIKQANDIKLKSKAVKTSKLTRKVFGFEGELALKNIKRNKSRYRATVISLVMSIVLFLSVTTFSTYLEKSLALTQSTINYQVSVAVYNDNGVTETNQSFFNTIRNSKYTKDSTVLTNLSIQLPEGKNYLSEQGEKQFENMALYGNVVGMEDEAFKKYAEKMNLNVDDFMNKEKIQGILYDKIKYNDGKKFIETNILNVNVGDSIKFNIEGDEVDSNEKVFKDQLNVGHIAEKPPFGYDMNSFGGLWPTFFVPQSVYDHLLAQIPNFEPTMGTLFMTSDHPDKLENEVLKLAEEKGITNPYITNVSKQKQQTENFLTIVKIFAYGFIILITLICFVNILNTISTSIGLRKREFAMLKSVGMTQKGFNKMIYFESLFYGLKALLYGLPLSFGVMGLLYMTLARSFAFGFYVPVKSMTISIIALFFIIGVIMTYSSNKLKKQNVIEGLKDENA